MFTSQKERQQLARDQREAEREMTRQEKRALRLLINTNASGGEAITLKHESTSSTAANRFRNATGGDYILPADGGSAVLTYSNAISRWRIL